MNKSNKGLLAGVGIGVVAVLLLQLLVGVVIAITGSYDIAASRDHMSFVRWMLSTTQQCSQANGGSGGGPTGYTTNEYRQRRKRI